MDITSYVLLSREMTVKKQTETTANNLANAGTTGYKRQNLPVAEFLSRPQGYNKRISFVQTLGRSFDAQEGAIENTNDPMDVAIHGPGYFVVTTQVGKRYTRSGAFHLNTQRELVTSGGYRLLTTQGTPITIPPEAGHVVMATNGEVSVTDRAGMFTRPLGTLSLVHFRDQKKLARAGDNLYVTQETPLPVEAPHIVQGALEHSNVNSVKETVNLLNNHRASQLDIKLISTAYDLQKAATQTLGTLNF